jgi:GNAT superfamily N-acetyltransferase
MHEQNAVIFRRATLDDVHKLADLRWRLQTDDEEVFDTGDRARFIDAFMDSVSGSFFDGPFVHWIAETDGKIVAVMSIGRVAKVPSPKTMDGHWGYLTNCYTVPAYRGRGIGGELLAAVKEWAKNQQYEFLAVWPSDRSYAFYERNGFHRYPDPLILHLNDI